jgi:hypothetical protein
VCKADNLTAFCEPTVCKMLEPRRHTTLLASTAYYKDIFTYADEMIQVLVETECKMEYKNKIRPTTISSMQMTQNRMK